MTVGRIRSSKAAFGFTGVDLISCLSVLIILAIVGRFAINHSRTSAETALCQRNLEQIDRAVLQFTQEHSSKLPGVLPPEAGDPWWFYKEQVKGYLGLNGASSEQDRVFACPADRGYSDPGPFASNSRFDYSSYPFNAITLNGVPNIAGWSLSEVAEPNRTLSVMEWCAHAPLSWHRSRTKKANRPFYSDAQCLVSFVDGHAEMTKIYYDGYNAAYTRDPIVGYNYRFSGR